MSTATLNDNEVRVRELFITQYMREFDAVEAALRMGYGHELCKSVAAQFMQDAYVLNRIEQERDKLGISDENEEHKRRIVAGLYREANNKKNSGGARVSAWTQLSKILGLEAPVKTDLNLHSDDELVFRIVDSHGESDAD